MVLNAIGRVADRLVSLVVPRTIAGACPCGDCFETCGSPCAGPLDLAFVCTNCRCDIVSYQCSQGACA
jgi:hypothetical protein